MNHRVFIIKEFLKKEWFLLLSLLPLLFTIIFLQFTTPIWDESTKNTVFYSVFIYDIAIILVFLYKNHTFLFEKGEWLRNSITIVGCGVVLLWTYKHKITFRLDILLLFLCALYGVIYRKYVKPTVLSIVFFVFIAIRIVGLLWAEHLEWGINVLIKEENIIFFVLVPIILLGFSVSERQQQSLIQICFKGFLMLLVANVVFYLFAISSLGRSVFSFITLNKGYFSYYEILFWSHFKHPSFISWIILAIGGLSFILWKKGKTLISISELIIYAVLVLCVALMVQARVVIISYFIVGAFFVFLSVEKHIKKSVKYSILGLLVLIGIGIVSYLISHTAYFSDPIRNEIYNKAFAAIREGNIWIGNGTGYHRYIIGSYPFYVHNDFVATLVDTGILGLSIFVVWILCLLLSKDILKQFLVVVSLPIMNTDVLFYFFEYTYIVSILLIFILLAPRFKSVKHTLPN